MKSIYYCIVALILSVFLIAYSGTLLGSQKENFVAWNNEEVREESPYGLIRDDDKVKNIFRKIVQEDSGKFAGVRFTNFKPTTSFEEEIKGVMHYILRRINKAGNRRFTALDTQSTRKEQTMDPEDHQVVNRWTVNLFIQEKNKHNVHGWAMNITFTMLQKGDLIKVEKLHTITDHFYKKPLVEGMNPHNKYYKLMNPFHLHKPWRTSGRVDGREVLMPDEETEQLLDVWHKDLKNPGYRCFTDAGDTTTPNERPSFFGRHGDRYKNREACETNQGTWDRPVENENECPFYRANKNYPNRLGGIKLHDRQCELPIGTKPIGYRYASSDPKHRPYCYNCKEGVAGPGSWGFCCDSQRDTELYPELASPDYAYPGDELERYQHRDVLAQRGLNWQRFPTKIRTIENKNQKQPVFNALVGPGPGKINLP
jgi:hypothetical protein